MITGLRSFTMSHFPGLHLCMCVGVHTDNPLSWSVQINTVCSRLQKRLYFLQFLKTLNLRKKYTLLFFLSCCTRKHYYTRWVSQLGLDTCLQTCLLWTALKVKGVHYLSIRSFRLSGRSCWACVL